MDTAWPVLTDHIAQLLVMSADEQSKARKRHLPEIRKYANADIGEDDVHILGMRIVNSKVATFYGQFTPEALNEIAEMLPGRPVMIGHNYDGAPIGRFFAARRVYIADSASPRNESYWVEALFYVLKGDPEGDAIARRIEAGIWSEVSLAWSFRSALCSACKNDVRTLACMHQPGEVYEDGGLAVFMMAGIVEVTEGSVVYAGAERGTHFFKASSGERIMRPGRQSEDSEGQLWIAASRVGSEKAAMLKAAEDQAHGDSLDAMLMEAAPRTRYPEPVRSFVQALICSRDRFETVGDAKRWARNHSFTADTVTEDVDGFHFQQFAATADAGDVKRIHVASGVSAVIVKPRRTSGEAQASLDQLLAS